MSTGSPEARGRPAWPERNDQPAWPERNDQPAWPERNDHPAWLERHDGPASDDWVGLGAEPLPVQAASEWAARPDCGAVVTFSGMVRDHAEGRPNVSALDYEAYDDEVEPRLAAIAAEARRRWPQTGRLALLHRTGHMVVGETSVVVVASAPHRDEAFAAARWCIDTLKATVPIWKRETWEGGEDWSACDHPVADVS